MKKVIITVTAIIAITIIEVVALSLGINGVMLASTLAILAGLGGWVAPTPKEIWKNGRK